MFSKIVNKIILGYVHPTDMFDKPRIHIKSSTYIEKYQRGCLGLRTSRIEPVDFACGGIL